VKERVEPEKSQILRSTEINGFSPLEDKSERKAGEDWGGGEISGGL